MMKETLYQEDMSELSSNTVSKYIPKLTEL